MWLRASMSLRYCLLKHRLLLKTQNVAVGKRPLVIVTANAPPKKISLWRVNQPAHAENAPLALVLALMYFAFHSKNLKYTDFQGCCWKCTSWRSYLFMWNETCERYISCFKTFVAKFSLLVWLSYGESTGCRHSLFMPGKWGNVRLCCGAMFVFWMWAPRR